MNLELKKVTMSQPIGIGKGMNVKEKKSKVEKGNGRM